MIVLAKLLRRAGVALAPEEMSKRPWTMVLLLTESDAATGGKRLALRDAEAHVWSPAQLELFQVTLATFAVDHFVLRGIERVETEGRTAAVVQELACKPMPELGGEGWQSPRAEDVARRFTSLSV